MATPDFILSLRAKIGHEQLWLPGVSLVVLDDADRALLGRRSDNGMWAVVSGIPEPGEQPGEAALRECVEETRVRPRILGVAQVRAEEPFAFANGDRAVFMDICFVARADASQVAATGVGRGVHRRGLVRPGPPARAPDPHYPAAPGRGPGLAW